MLIFVSSQLIIARSSRLILDFMKCDKIKEVISNDWPDFSAIWLI